MVRAMGGINMGDVKQTVHEGGCLCGHVRFSVVGEPCEPVGNCHCRLCQKSSGAAFVTWAIFPMDAVTWLKAQPKWFRATDFAERGFCPECGASVSIHDFAARTLDLPVVLFDDPDVFPPQDDIWLESRRAWVALDPQLAHFQHSGSEDEKESE